MSDTLSPYQRHAVALGLTEFLARHGGDRDSQVAWLNRMLAALSPVPVKPSGPRGGWPSGRVALHALGMSGDSLDDLCLVARANGRVLHDDVLSAFFDTPLWLSAWNLVELGPVKAWRRYEPLLRLWSRGLEPDGSARRRGKLSKGSIHIASAVFFSFALALDELRKIELGDDDDELRLRGLGAPSHVYSRWSRADVPARPDAEALGAAPANKEVSGPPFRFTRLILLGLDWEVQQRKRTAEGRALLFRALRDRAVIGLALTGARCGALARTQRPIKEYEWPDGLVTAAIDLNPRKSAPRDLVRPKALDDLVYEWVEEYADYVGIEEGARLLHGDIGRPYATGKQVSNRIAAILKFPSERRLRANPYFRAAADMWPTRRISAHPLRHLVETVAYEVGLDEEVADRGEIVNWDGLSERRVRVPAQVYPDTLLDHQMRGIGDLYKDAATERGRRIYGRKAGLGVYEYFLTERGARKSPDADTVAAAAQAVAEATAARDAIAGDLEALENEILSVDLTLLPASERATVQAEHNQKIVLLGRLARRLVDAETRLGAAKAESNAAKEVRIPIDDLAEPNAIPVNVEPERDDPELPVLREYAWTFEFRWALGDGRLPESTLRRWMSGQLPFPLGDRRNLIEPEAVEALSERVRRIRLDKLDWSRFPLEVQERLEVIRRTPDPGRKKRRDAGTRRRPPDDDSASDRREAA